MNRRAVVRMKVYLKPLKKYLNKKMRNTAKMTKVVEKYSSLVQASPGVLIQPGSIIAMNMEGLGLKGKEVGKLSKSRMT